MLHYLPVIIILSCGAFYALKAKKLTVPAAFTGAIIGFSIFIGAGYIGLGILTAFFILGTVATSWKINVKRTRGLAEENGGRRTAGQVFANAGVGGLLGLLIIVNHEHYPVYMLMLAAAFSSAAADTLSSELGNVYGQRFYNILTFKKDERGLNGVVSIEGILYGVLGSCIIALVYYFAVGLDKKLLQVVVAGTLGNLADSVLGASLERKRVLNNDAVNFLNTAFAALVACAMDFVF